MSEWKEYKFSDLLIDESISYGIVQPGSHKECDSVPIIRVNNVKDGNIQAKDVLKVDKEIESKYQRTRLQGGELLITVVGSVGECAIVPKSLTGWNVARAISVARLKNDFDIHFVKYSFKTDDIIFQMYGNTNDTVQPTLNLSELKSIKFNMPPLPEQRAIASVLSSLDDKIDLLHRQNATLEKMAETLFRRWFVEEAKEEWEESNIYSLIDVTYGFAFKSQKFNENGNGLPLIRIRDLKDGKLNIFTDEDYDEKYLIKTGDLVAGMDGEFKIYIWSGIKSLLNQRVCKFSAKYDYVPQLYVFELIKPHLYYYENTKVGTTVIHLGKSDLDEIKIALPSKDTLICFGELTNPIYQKLISNFNQIRTLTQLRDTLLPKLMSGEVRVEI